MSSLDLHGARTGNCLRAAIALAESGLPFRAIPVDLPAGAHRTAAFAALNPMGKVPVLVVDDGDGPWALAQSGAIMLEVARRSGERLLPAAPRARALALERFFYFLTDAIAPSHAGFYLARLGQKSPAAMLEALAIDRLAAAGHFIATSEWMGGSHFSLADIAAHTLMAAMGDAFAERHGRLGEWFTRVSSRPAVRLGWSAFG